jgi:FkbM family methyltransferase
VGPSGRVVAVEANSDVCNELCDVVKLNKISNSVVLNIVLNHSSNTLTINHEGDSYLSGSLQHSETVAKGFEVEGMPLSELFDRLGIKEVDFLKVNIEGAERFLAEAVNPDIFKNVRNIAISCHDFRYKNERVEFFKTKDIVVDYFKRLGFDIRSQSTGFGYVDDWVYGVRKEQVLFPIFS